MKWGAHACVAGSWAALAGALVSQALAGAGAIARACLIFVGACLAVPAAILPDCLDRLFRRAGAAHRNKVTHGTGSLGWACPALAVACFACLPALPAAFAALGCAIGWGSHLFLDALTPAGIYCKGRTRSWDWARYDSPTANRVLKRLSLSFLAGAGVALVDPFMAFIPLLGGVAWARGWHSAKVWDTDALLLLETPAGRDAAAELDGIAVCLRRLKRHGAAGYYRAAARQVRSFQRKRGVALEAGRIADLPGMSPAAARVINEVLRTGTSAYFRHLRGQVFASSR